MEAFIAWCGFFGAWLLVAGPLYQAAIELSSQGRESQDVGHLVNDAQHGGAAGAPPPVSIWWWLFPPVLFIKHQRRDAAVREQLLSQLTPEQTELLVDYMHKAAGWGLVGLGGLLIAAKETWELREHYEWAHWTFWALVVVMVALCLGNAGLRMRRSQDIIEKSRSRTTAA